MASKAQSRRRKNPRRTRKAPEEAGRFGLLKADKSKFYVWANANDISCGVEKYLADGYEVEVYTEEGVRPAIGRTAQVGEEISNSGHLLMSIDKEERAEIETFGAEGESGQELADIFEERMFKRDGVTDRFRGLKNSRIDGLKVSQTRESLA